MSKNVLQALEFVTEQTCTLLLCSPTPSVSPFKLLGQPVLAFGVRCRERRSLVKQTCSTKQRKGSPLCSHVTWLCWERVALASSENYLALCAEEMKFTGPETGSALRIAPETRRAGQKPSKAGGSRKVSIFHLSKNRGDFILPSLWQASLY